MKNLLDMSKRVMEDAISAFNPTHIVAMVSGGKDSTCSYQVLKELGYKADLIIHGNTRTGLQGTTQFVIDNYSDDGPDFAIADAGTTYEDKVLDKGFFGTGPSSHVWAYRFLKKDHFNRVMSREIRKRRPGYRVMLVTGARRSESAERAKHLQPFTLEPQNKNNAWVPIIIDWTQEDRDQYLHSRKCEINPVAKALCRSGECMCGTMQSKAERIEAAMYDPQWGEWLDKLEAEVIEKHGYGWGVKPTKPIKQVSVPVSNFFQPMCTDCTTKIEQT